MSEPKTGEFQSPDMEEFVCDLCKAKLDSRDEFREHLKKQHNIPV